MVLSGANILWELTNPYLWSFFLISPFIIFSFKDFENLQSESLAPHVALTGPWPRHAGRDLAPWRQGRRTDRQIPLPLAYHPDGGKTDS